MRYDGYKFPTYCERENSLGKNFTLYELSPYHHHYHLTRNGLYEPHKRICILFEEFGTEMLHRF